MNTMSNKEEAKSHSTKWARLVSWVRHSVLYKIFQFIVSSAAVSLLITIIIFVVEQREDAYRTESMINNLEDISNNLLDVQNSVSTRYLGIFPDYLQEVNALLDEMTPRDSVVIFEDVLYYGILSRPENFIRMNHMLLSHADNGGKVTIAYYDIEGRTFHRMIREQRINPCFWGDMDAELDSMRRKRKFDDSEVCEKYFNKSREKNFESFSRNVDRYLSRLQGRISYDDDLGRELEQIYVKMDSVKTYYLGKPKRQIAFADYEDMYKGMSRLLIEKYLAHGIELIPLDEYLTMTCWLVSGRAVLAFPSKYATDEIGFYSKDPAFSKYISTMLNGVRGYYRD